MEKNCDITGEMGDHLPIKRPRQDQSSSESPVAAKPFPNDTNWADLIVKELKEIATASDLDDARNRADKLLKSFKTFERACLIPRTTEGQTLKAGSCKGPFDPKSPDFIWDNVVDISNYANSIQPFVPGLIETESEDEDEDEETKAKEKERLLRRKWGIDENGQMPEHLRRELKLLGM